MSSLARSRNSPIFTRLTNDSLAKHVAMSKLSHSQREEEIPAIVSNTAQTAAVSSDGVFLVAAA